MKFIRDLIEEKSRSIQGRPDPEQEQAETVEPDLGRVPLQEVNQMPPRAEYSAPVAPLPDATAKMETPEPEATGPDEGFEDGQNVDLSDLNGLRQALAASDDSGASDIFEDEIEFAGANDDAELPEPAPVVEEEAEEQVAVEEPADLETRETPVVESKPSEPVEEIAEAVQAPLEVPRPAAGRSNRQSGRVKTRILGFSSPNSAEPDPFEKASEASSAQVSNFPVGWLAVVDGPGRGAAFTIFDGVAQIGRGEDQAVRLDFGDNSISRQNHAAIAYDNEQKSFFLGHGGKANLVRLNGRPVLSTEELHSEDTVRIGETTLRFIALCGQNFSWDQNQEGEVRNASVG